MRTHPFLRQRRRGALRLSLCACWLLLSLSPAGRTQTAPAKTPSILGTIKTISSNSVTLTTDTGAEVTLPLSPEVKVLQVPPGSKDLKEATPIQVTDLQPGDRVLVRTRAGENAPSSVASTIIAMKKMDIAAKRQKDAEDWQRHGIGGLVSSVDAAENTVTIKTLTAAGPKDINVHVQQNTILRRYAPGSVNFDEAKVAPIADIKPGDQLRARGKHSADGNEFIADEVVSGSFRNIAGIVSNVNAGSSTLTVNDLATKRPVELKVTTESQMRKVPERMAQGIAMRLKGGAPVGNGGATPVGQPGGPPATGGAQGAANNTGNGNGNGGAGGARGGSDLQQMLNRLPVSPLSDFQKGDAVMVVATSGEGDGPLTVITLLGGVEPILQATSQGQAASILSPWSLSQSGGSDVGTP